MEYLPLLIMEYLPLLMMHSGIHSAWVCMHDF